LILETTPPPPFPSPYDKLTVLFYGFPFFFGLACSLRRLFSIPTPLRASAHLIYSVRIPFGPDNALRPLFLPPRSKGFPPRYRHPDFVSCLPAFQRCWVLCEVRSFFNSLQTRTRLTIDSPRRFSSKIRTCSSPFFPLTFLVFVSHPSQKNISYSFVTYPAVSSEQASSPLVFRPPEASPVSAILSFEPFSLHDGGSGQPTFSVFPRTPLSSSFSFRLLRISTPRTLPLFDFFQ